MTASSGRPVARIGSAADPLRVAVLASGGGSNLQALLDAIGPQTPWRVVVVIVNVEGAGAIGRATARGVPVQVIPHKGRERVAHEADVVAALVAANVEVVVLAGYMRIVTADLVASFPHRIVNVHPALLPSFPGMHGARQALDHGCRVTGCTVHLVDAGVDTGPILAQAAVPVLDGDDEAALQRRIQVEEHRLLPLVVTALAEGRVVDDGSGGRAAVRCHGVK